MRKPGRRSNDEHPLPSREDPFRCFMVPPPNETAEEKAIRVAKEVEAKRVSDEIDLQIKADRKVLLAGPREGIVKLLLLGQSESGKSTTLKNMKLSFAPQAWFKQRASWRAVIHLNLVRTVNTIVDLVTTELSDIADSVPSSPVLKAYGALSWSTSPPSSSRGVPPPLALSRSNQHLNPPSTVSSLHGHGSDEDFTSSAHETLVDQTPHRNAHLTQTHALLSLRLRPLTQVENDLKRLLGPGSTEVTPNSEESSNGLHASPFDRVAYRTRPSTPKKRLGWRGGSTKEDSEMAQTQGLEVLAGLIASCVEDMRELCDDPEVRDLVRRWRRGKGKRRSRNGRGEGLELGDATEYFMDNISRIASPNYEPTDDDILRARIRTLGVQEHRIVFEMAGDLTKQWLIYDVGGARTQRAAWIPFFESINTILFLAPVSCFDETLAEDPTVNRLFDSYLLWKSIVSSPIFKDAPLILFLNKFDLLELKIARGARLKDYMISYGDRPNDAETFVKYLRVKFKDQLKDHSPPDSHRPFYAFTTSVVDRHATAETLSYVRDGILREHLRSGFLL